MPLKLQNKHTARIFAFEFSPNVRSPQLSVFFFVGINADKYPRILIVRFRRACVPKGRKISFTTYDMGAVVCILDARVKEPNRNFGNSSEGLPFFPAFKGLIARALAMPAVHINYTHRIKLPFRPSITETSTSTRNASNIRRAVGFNLKK